MTDLNFLRRWMAFGAIMLVVTTLTVVIGVAVMFAMSWQLALIFLAAAVPIMIYGFRFRHPVQQGGPAQPGPGRGPRHHGRGVRARHPRPEGLRPQPRGAGELQRTGRGTAPDRDRQGQAPGHLQPGGDAPARTRARAPASSWASCWPPTASSPSAPWWPSSPPPPWSPRRWSSRGMLLAMALTAKTAVDRHFEVMDAQNTITSPDQPRARPPSLKGALSFHNATFAFEDAPDKPILKDINLDIRPGETMALVGITGSGKSALLQLVPRLYDVTGGSITIDGVDLRDFARRGPAHAWSPWRSRTPRCSPAPSGTTSCSARPTPDRRRPRRGPGGGARRRAGPLRLLPAGRGGHPDRRGGPQPLRRPAPAHRPGPGHRREPGRAGPGRPALGAGREHRGARRSPAARRSSRTPPR